MKVDVHTASLAHAGTIVNNLMGTDVSVRGRAIQSKRVHTSAATSSSIVED